MTKLLLLFISIIPFNIVAQQKDPGKTMVSPDKVSPAKNKDEISFDKNVPVNNNNKEIFSADKSLFPLSSNTIAMVAWFHRFLDTATLTSIQRYMSITPDSVLYIIQHGEEDEMRDFYQTNYYSLQDRDGDGHQSYSSGGDDCNDFNPFVHAGSVEFCYGGREIDLGGIKYFLIYKFMDEDCNPLTVANYSVLGDGDADRDGEISCSCVNETNSGYITSEYIYNASSKVSIFPYHYQPGWSVICGNDCDDKNFSLTKNSQKCISVTSTGMCVNGVWQILPCKKCITQANGTGIVIEW